MKEQIEQLKKNIADAKARHAEAQQDIKRIEKDMKEFDNNKDDKLAELQTSLDTLKKSLNKNSIAVKTLHKELQASRLESEQAGSDLTAAEEQLAEADGAMQAQVEEIETLKKEQTRIKVRYTFSVVVDGNTDMPRMPMILHKLSWKRSKPN